jgi:hypothetical protein
MPAITFHSPVMDERRPPTLAECNGNLDLHKVRSQTHRILNAPADLRVLSDGDLIALDYACTALWRDLDCDALQDRVCVERSRRGLDGAFQGRAAA